MYRIYAGDNLIYSPALVRNNYVLTSAGLNMELNKASTLKFTIPRISSRKAFLQSFLKTEITAFDGDRRIFRGRIISNAKDFYQNEEIYCEGELAYLRDRILRPYKLEGYSPAEYFTWILGQYNSLVDDNFNNKKFVKGVCTVQGDDADFENNQYPDVLSEMTDKLLNAYGGYFVVRYENGVNYLDYLVDPGGSNPHGAQSIRYGKNLLDIKDETSAAPVYTVVVPLGATTDNERLTIGDNPGIDDYIAAEQSIIDEYGWIENVVTHDQIKDRDELIDAGNDDIQNATSKNKTLEVTAVDLSLIHESDEPLTLGKQYQLIFQAGGYDNESPRLRLNRIEMNLFHPNESRYFFGAITTGITHEAVSTKRTMNQVTRVALEAAESVTELSGKVDVLEAAILDLQDRIDDIKEIVTFTQTINNVSWSANAGGGKAATITVSLPSSAPNNYKCNVSVIAGGAIIVGGLSKSRQQLSVSLVNFTDSDPSSITVDVQLFE